MQTNTQNPIHRWLYKEQEKREKVKGGNSGGTPKTPTFCMLSLYYLPKLWPYANVDYHNSKQIWL